MFEFLKTNFYHLNGMRFEVINAYNPVHDVTNYTESAHAHHRHIISPRNVDRPAVGVAAECRFPSSNSRGHPPSLRRKSVSVRESSEGAKIESGPSRNNLDISAFLNNMDVP